MLLADRGYDADWISLTQLCAKGGRAADLERQADKAAALAAKRKKTRRGSFMEFS
jgi:hypothetical protein